MPLTDPGREAPSLVIRLFGPFDARLDGRPLPPFRSRKGQWLLALLVLRHSREVDRAWLAGLLWPESAEPQALANLRISLTDLRHALGPEARRLHAPTPRTLSLDLAGAEVDVVAFDAAIARGDTAALEEAVALYRGALLEGCAEEWAFQERHPREAAYLEALEWLAATASEHDDPMAAERHLRRALAVDPSRETTQRALMQALAASGNYAAMIQAYRKLRAHLHQEFNTEPDAETQALFAQLRAEARTKGRRGEAARRRMGDPTTPADGAAVERADATSELAPAPPHSVPPSALPAGTVTFLFTDVEGSTKLWDQDPEAMGVALARHDALLHQAIENNHGYLFKTVGDAFCAAFATAADAVASALGTQRSLQCEAWGEIGPLQVRIALHTGTAEARDGDYFGPPLNRVERLLETGHGGQVLLSLATQELVQDHLPSGASLHHLGNHRLRDLQRPEDVFQLAHPDLPARFPPLRSVNSLPHNLPQQVTSFIGREQEVAAVKRLLETTRLLTLTGPGGTGKSRLALQVAADLLEAYGDGVWLVEFAPLSDPALVADAVATVLGVREQPRQPLLQTVLGALKSKRLLLILDNCEHLLPACAELSEALLRDCPGVRLLATSREGLNIQGETTYRLPTLALPDPEHLLPAHRGADSLSALTQHEAVRLFIDRATAAQPSFTITHQNAPAIAQVCCRLDGIPLAIELAAARIKALPVEKISERLDDRFRLLTSGSRTAPPRQQTLRALIDWSYDLLSAAERALLRRLSVFSGGWSLEAAEAVCSDFGLEIGDSGLGADASAVPNPQSPIQEEEVLDLLTSLVEKSLIQYEARDGEGRYRLLETVRQYGWERLREVGEAELVRRWHCDWFLELAERAEPELFGPPLFGWLDRLETEHDNLRSALAWSIEHDPEAGLRMAGALWVFWAIRGHVHEAQGRLAGLLSRREAAEPTLTRAKALIAAEVMAFSQGELEWMRALAEESLAIARQLGSRRHIAHSLLHLGLFYQIEDFQVGEDYGRSTALYEECVAVARDVGEKWLLGLSLSAFGNVVLHQANLERAQALLEESLLLLRESGNPWMIQFPLMHLADHAVRRGDGERAKMFCQECLILQQSIGDTWSIAHSLHRLACVNARQGDLERAARLSAAAETALEPLGTSWPRLMQIERERAVADARTSLGEDAYAAAWAGGRAMTLEQAVSYALEEGAREGGLRPV